MDDAIKTGDEVVWTRRGGRPRGTVSGAVFTNETTGKRMAYCRFDTGEAMSVPLDELALAGKAWPPTIETK